MEQSQSLHPSCAQACVLTPVSGSDCEREVVNPMPLQKVTKPMRAIFTARDPRDLVVAVSDSSKLGRVPYLW
jgi:hypothetical protein